MGLLGMRFFADGLFTTHHHFMRSMRPGAVVHNIGRRYLPYRSIPTPKFLTNHIQPCLGKSRLVPVSLLLYVCCSGCRRAAFLHGRVRVLRHQRRRRLCQRGPQRGGILSPQPPCLFRKVGGSKPICCGREPIIFLLFRVWYRSVCFSVAVILSAWLGSMYNLYTRRREK